MSMRAHSIAFEIRFLANSQYIITLKVSLVVNWINHFVCGSKWKNIYIYIYIKRNQSLQTKIK